MVTEEHGGSLAVIFSVFLFDFCDRELLVPISPVHHALNAVFQAGYMEVDEQSDAFPA